MLTTYNHLMAEEQKITDQYQLKSSIKTLSTRWMELVRKSDELSSRYDTQYRAWASFDSDLNGFREQILNELEQRVHTTISTDINRLLDLNRINALLAELRVGNFSEEICSFLYSLDFSLMKRIIVLKHRLTLVYKSS